MRAVAPRNGSDTAPPANFGSFTFFHTPPIERAGPGRRTKPRSTVYGERSS